MQTDAVAHTRSAPVVSVVLPVRNGLPYLPEAVDSILRQSYRNLELIVVDDGSTDYGRNWLATRARDDDRLRLTSNPGRGLVAALNYGIAQASGTYIARMDADDIALPERFALQVSFLERRPEIAVLGAQATHIDENGDSLGYSTSYPTEPSALSRSLAEKGCTLLHPTAMARRTAVLEAGGYRHVTETAEDYDLWLRLDERFSLANLPETLLRYRRHSKQVSTGVNWRQRLARDMALLSARERRAGRPDPLNDLEQEIATRPSEEVMVAPCALELRKLHDAYNGASLLETGSNLLDAHQAQAIIEATRGRYFGDGGKLRCEIAARAARASFKAHYWRAGAEAALLSLSMAPGRALSAMLGRNARGAFRY